MANTDQNPATDKPRVAKHEYLDSSGAMVDEEESAQAYRYSLLGGGDAFVWDYSKATDDEKRMVAMFGAKTLATNVASAHRQKNGASDYAGQIEAVAKRFGKIREGTWVERGEGGGFAIKPELLCQAINAYQQESGKPLTGTDELMRRLEEEEGFKEKVRKVPGVAAHYSRLAGRQTASLDDLGL